MKKLNLALKKKYYTMTGEPGKMYELRDRSNWLLSRLLTKDGTKRHYDCVELCDGYKRGRETKLRGYAGFDFLLTNKSFTLPNGESVDMKIGDIIIYLK